MNVLGHKNKTHELKTMSGQSRIDSLGEQHLAPVFLKQRKLGIAGERQFMDVSCNVKVTHTLPMDFLSWHVDSLPTFTLADKPPVAQPPVAPEPGEGLCLLRGCHWLLAASADQTAHWRTSRQWHPASPFNPQLTLPRPLLHCPTVARKAKTKKPAKPQKAVADKGLLRDPAAARPLASLVFLAPMLAFYAIGVVWLRQDARADILLRDALGWLGVTGYLAPTWMIVVILLVWHVLRRDPWQIPWGTVGLMAAETAILAVPLVLLAGIFNVASHGPALLAIGGREARSWIDVVQSCIGAGIFEELIFRLLMVGGTMYILRGILKEQSAGAAIAVVLIAAAVFAGAHLLDHPDRFSWDRFLFRSAAGIYLGFIFLYRGFGVAAGTHILFNAVVRAVL
jgi:hypothetical protein